MLDLKELQKDARLERFTNIIEIKSRSLGVAKKEFSLTHTYPSKYSFFKFIVNKMAKKHNMKITSFLTNDRYYAIISNSKGSITIKIKK
jgi:hypothetical protein